MLSAPRAWSASNTPLACSSGNPVTGKPRLAVLRATLQALVTMQAPGEVVHLPFEWTLSDEETNAHPPVPPPITQYLKAHPMQVIKLIKREIPDL